MFLRTKECTEVTRQDYFEQCRPLLDLRQEMAKAIRKRELETEVPRLKDELDRQQRPEEARASELAIGGVWAWIMGAGVVFVATFGTVIFARIEGAPTANDNEAAAAPWRSAVEPRMKPRNWVREFRKFHGRNPGIRELQEAFPGTPKTTAWRRCRAA